MNALGLFSIEHFFVSRVTQLTIITLIHPLFLTFIPLYSIAASMKKEDVQKIHFLKRLDLKEMRS